MKIWRLLTPATPTIAFSSALGVSRFPLLPNELLSAHFPPSFSNAHDSPMAVRASWQPHAAVGIARATSTAWSGLGNGSWCRAGRGGQFHCLTAAPKNSH